ncbi:MAG: hypothetical protein EX271_01720 [Acidimicrobiales bacterium]|nr:hypothetical protein [Hyphomonadaceae bacterium]RZV44430.1 MAG: hypothetical protein EX271_01720 [Acidimicrobiales bacterium]
MSARPKIRLSRLRDIGWTHWNPIGLLEPGQNWEDISNADKYDGYLILVAGMVRNDIAEEEAIEYLMTIESEHMGLGRRSREAAEATIIAIQADDQLWNNG